MNKSDSIAKLAKALCMVQSNLKPAIKDAKNPFFKSSYADLNSVWDACRKLLAMNGLAVAQLNQPADNGVIVETVLMHESGEWISGEMFLPLNKQDAQSVGSAMTYGRRYGLAAIVGIVADDDDGNAAQQQPKQYGREDMERIQARQPDRDESKPSMGQLIASIKTLRLNLKIDAPIDFSRMDYAACEKTLADLRAKSQEAR